MAPHQLLPSPTSKLAATSLTRILVEVTNRCNLDCEICIRRSWRCGQGEMSYGTFQKLLQDLAALEYYEVPPAENEELLIHVTDTPDEEEEKVLQKKPVIRRISLTLWKIFLRNGIKKIELNQR